jgi:hypothetical protein
MRLYYSIALSTLLAGGVSAQQKEPLHALDRLVGTWEAQDSAGVRKGEVITMSYRWGKHRKSFQYDIARVSSDKTTPTHEGMSWWDPVKQRIVFSEVDNYGNLASGAFSVAGEGLTIEEVLTLADGRAIEVRGEIVFHGVDAFTFHAATRKGEDWVPAVQLRYRRIGD